MSVKVWGDAVKPTRKYLRLVTDEGGFPAIFLVEEDGNPVNGIRLMTVINGRAVFPPQTNSSVKEIVDAGLIVNAYREWSHV